MWSLCPEHIGPGPGHEVPGPGLMGPGPGNIGPGAFHPGSCDGYLLACIHTRTHTYIHVREVENFLNVLLLHYAITLYCI